MLIVAVIPNHSVWIGAMMNGIFFPFWPAPSEVIDSCWVVGSNVVHITDDKKVAACSTPEAV